MTDTNDPAYKERLKHARKQATVFGILAITALIIIVYALFNKEAADKARVQAEIRLEECEKRAEAAEQQLATQKILLEKALMDAKAWNKK